MKPPGHYLLLNYQLDHQFQSSASPYKSLSDQYEFQQSECYLTLFDNGEKPIIKSHLRQLLLRLLDLFRRKLSLPASFQFLKPLSHVEILPFHYYIFQFS